MFRIPLAASAVSALVAAALPAQSPSTPPFRSLPSTLDSGFLANPTPHPAIVFTERVRVAGASWIQLRFAPTVSLPDGSYLRLTGTRDGAVQRHAAGTLVDWDGWSAAFNGDEVVVELIAAAASRGNRAVATTVLEGLPAAGPSTDTLCANDDRTASTDERAGRLWLGCTGWLIGEDLALTAGHCQSANSPLILEFRVPLSTPSGNVRRAHPDDQYRYVRLQGRDGGIGNDWAVLRVGRNSTHGLLPTERNSGQWFHLGTVPAASTGQPIRVTGYGTTSAPVSPTLHLAQKTHSGPLSQVRSTSLCYATDTTGGNSGSPVIDETSGSAIGIHTHGGCSGSGGGCNSGTRIDRPDLQSALLAAGHSSGRFTPFGTGCQGTATWPADCGARNRTGGTLDNVTAANEYAYAAQCASPMTLTGFRVFSRSTVGGPVTVAAAVYADAGGVPDTAPLARTTITIGASAGFHLATFATPVAVPAGTFYLAVDHSAGTTLLANLQSGTPGNGFWRRPAFSGSWSPSSNVDTPSFFVETAGTVVPALAGAGRPSIGQTYSAELTGAAPGATWAVLSGFSATNSGGGPLPIDLGPLGAPGCGLLVDPLAVDSGTTDPQGAARRSFQVAANPSLVGLAVYHQALVLDAQANRLGIAMSNGLRVDLGD